MNTNNVYLVPKEDQKIVDLGGGEIYKLFKFKKVTKPGEYNVIMADMDQNIKKNPVPRLRELARFLGHSSASTLNKSQLVEFITPRIKF